MRTAFVSDIHGNLPAWKTVLTDFALKGVDRIICLGDVVGYGPQPAECLSSVYAHATDLVLGNHDAVVGGRMDPSVFNERARRVIEWTREKLGSKATSLFSSLPLVLVGPGFRCTHGSFVDPAGFNYVLSEEDAAACFAACPEQLLFVGHSHRAELYVTGHSGATYKIPPQDFALEDGKRYLINVGSVGSPRDGDPRASYVLYDDQTRCLFFHRVTFDLDAFRAAVAEAIGLEETDVQLLRLTGAPQRSVREETDFAPDVAVRAKVDVVERELAKRALSENRRLRRLFRMAAAACVLLLAVCAAVVYINRDPGATFPEEEPSSIPASFNGAKDGNLLVPFVAFPTKEFTGCAGYRIHLSDRSSQTAGTTAEGSLVLTGTAAAEVSVESPLIEFGKISRFEMMACVKPSADFDGALQILLVGEATSGGETVLMTRDFSPSKPVGVSYASLPDAMQRALHENGWSFARGTVWRDRMGEGLRGVRLRLTGTFRGRVEVGGLSVRRK